MSIPEGTAIRPELDEDDPLQRKLAVAHARAQLFGAASSPPSPPAAVTVGRFVVEQRLGRGGLGVVYAARDTLLERPIALKLLLKKDDEATLREARAMARLQHPNVVAVHDVGVDDGRVWIAMERVDGPTLRRWWPEQSERARLAVLVAVGRALAAAHALGLVHHDVKPENVLIGKDGRARVSDFGLAVIHERADDDSASGAGTPGYQAPEKKASAKADQYSFCVMAREILGDAPPPAVQKALARGLQDNPDDRWPAMDPLCDALEEAAKKTHPLLLALAVVLGVVVVGAAFLQMWMFSDWMYRR